MITIKKYIGIIILLIFLLTFSFIFYFNKNIILLIISIIWVFLLSIIYFLIIKFNKIYLYRRIYFFIISIIFILGFKTINSQNSISPYCHIALGSNILSIFYTHFLGFINSTWTRYGILGLGILWLIILLLISGSSFCGWICFYGGIDDFFSGITKNTIIKLPINNKYRLFQLAFAIFIIIISFQNLEPIFCTWICPYKIRNDLINPNSYYFIIQTIIYITIGILFLIIFPIFTKKRTFCSIICPIGAFIPLFNNYHPLKIKIDNNLCNKCGVCYNNCPVFAIEKKEGNYYINNYCVLCGKCIDNCPENAILPILKFKSYTNILVFISFLLSGLLSIYYIPHSIYNLLKYIKL